MNGRDKMKKTERSYRIRKMRMAKRRQMMCRRCIFAVATLILLVGAALSFRSLSVKAKSGVDEQILYKYYKNIEVQPNDTLWTLAMSNYCDEKQSIQEYILEVQSINHLKDGQIVAGSHIVLPYYSTEFIYY